MQESMQPSIKLPYATPGQDSNIVPLPTESASPPSERPRESKRLRSPPSSPPAGRPFKNLRTGKGKSNKCVSNDYMDTHNI